MKKSCPKIKKMPKKVKKTGNGNPYRDKRKQKEQSREDD